MTSDSLLLVRQFFLLVFSNHFNQIRRQPDVDLLKAFLQTFLIFDDELAVFRSIGDVNEDTNIQITVKLTAILPLTFDLLGFRRDRAELLPQLANVCPSNFCGTGLPSLKLVGSRSS